VVVVRIGLAAEENACTGAFLTPFIMQTEGAQGNAPDDGMPPQNNQ
jgi:hypothetical protein